MYNVPESLTAATVLPSQCVPYQQDTDFVEIHVPVDIIALRKMLFLLSLGDQDQEPLGTLALLRPH